MRIRPTALLVLLTLAAFLPGCAAFTTIGKSMGLVRRPVIDLDSPTPTADFKFSIEGRDIASPPTDYVYTFERSGKCTYDVTVRSPRRRHDSGEFEISEDQVVLLWRTLRDANFRDLNPAYPASGGDGPDRALGVQTVYAYAGGADLRVVTRFQALDAVEKIRAAALGLVPEWIREVRNDPTAIPKEYLGDTTTHVFHVPDCVRLKDVPAQQRQAFATPYDALNFSFSPCPECRPMKSTTK